MTDEKFTTKVYIWRNPVRGEVAVAARTEGAARKAILEKNPKFAVLLQGDPLVVDPNDTKTVVHRWRRY